MTLASPLALSGLSRSPSHLRSVSECSPSAPTSSPASSPLYADVADAAGALRRYEAAVAAARGAGFELGLALHRAETTGGRSPLIGRRVFAAITASQAGLDAAMTHVNEAHRRAAVYADELGIPATSYGEQTEPENEEERRRSRG